MYLVAERKCINICIGRCRTDVIDRWRTGDQQPGGAVNWLNFTWPFIPVRTISTVSRRLMAATFRLAGMSLTTAGDCT